MVTSRPFTTALPDFDRMLEDFVGRTAAALTTEFAPALDVAEDDDGYTVRAEMAGVAPADVEVSVEDAVLTIRGEKKPETPLNGGRLHRSERRYGKFVRTVQFPTALDSDQVTASHKAGVLTVRLPKHARAKARTVKVEIAE